MRIFCINFFFLEFYKLKFKDRKFIFLKKSHKKLKLIEKLRKFWGEGARDGGKK